MREHEAELAAIFEDHIAVAQATRDGLLGAVAELAAQLTASLRSGGKLIVFGNGGSAADAQHFAAELVGRFRRERAGLPAIALAANTSTLTAIANDYDYREVFARQVEAFCREGDVVVGISTSGRAANVVLALRRGRERGGRTWALTGAGGSEAAAAAEHALRVPSDVTARVQEMHITLIHAVSELVDASLSG